MFAKNVGIFALGLVMTSACAGSAPAPIVSTQPTHRAMDPIAAVELTVRIAPDPSAPLHMEIGGLSVAAEGRVLRMARGVAGAYRFTDYSPYIRNLEVFDASGKRLEISSIVPGVWRIEGAGELARVSYDVDIAGMSSVINDMLMISHRDAQHLAFLGSSALLGVEGAEDARYRVTLDLPPTWASAWSLHKIDEAHYEATSLFELWDEPALFGDNIQSVRIDDLTPARYVHVWSETGDGVREAQALAEAARLSARGIAALGFSAHKRPYHVFAEVWSPGAGKKTGWAMEHGYSFQMVSEPKQLAAVTPKLIYHVIHHELHAYVPRALYTDRLRPERQVMAEPSEFIFFAEGFVQYLAFVGLARSGGADTETALRLLSERFARFYEKEAPLEPRSLINESRRICAGDSTNWMWNFSAGGLAALWIDEQLRARSPGSPGVLEAMLALYRRWERHPVGIPEDTFEEVFSEAAGARTPEVWSAHIRGSKPLPLEVILEGAGIRREGEGYRVLPDAEVSEAVVRFRRSAFR